LHLRVVFRKDVKNPRWLRYCECSVYTKNALEDRIMSSNPTWIRSDWPFLRYESLRLPSARQSARQFKKQSCGFARVVTIHPGRCTDVNHFPPKKKKGSSFADRALITASTGGLEGGGHYPAGNEVIPWTSLRVILQLIQGFQHSHPFSRRHWPQKQKNMWPSDAWLQVIRISAATWFSKRTAQTDDRCWFFKNTHWPFQLGSMAFEPLNSTDCHVERWKLPEKTTVTWSPNRKVRADELQTTAWPRRPRLTVCPDVTTSSLGAPRSDMPGLDPEFTGVDGKRKPRCFCKHSTQEVRTVQRARKKK